MNTMDEENMFEHAKCVTGLSPTGCCGSAQCCENRRQCCLHCSDDDCNIRCGWLTSDVDDPDFYEQCMNATRERYDF